MNKIITWIKNKLGLRIYGKTKLLLAFEYGLVLAETASKQNVELNQELSLRAEDMIENEFSKNDATHCGVQMLPNILSVFETDSAPKDDTEETDTIIS